MSQTTKWNAEKGLQKDYVLEITISKKEYFNDY